MVLLDTNIVIYSYQKEFINLRDYIENNESVVSSITYIEALGYQKITQAEIIYLENFFNLIEILPINQQIVVKAKELRQQQKMTLGDAIVAATALVHHLTLVTRNTKDFDWINELILINPIDFVSIKS